MSKVMMKDEKQASALVPRLRFPEFRDAGGWREVQLGDFCEINPSNVMLPESFVYIDLESVEAGQLIKRRQVSREMAPSRAQRVLLNGDILFQTVRPYQKNNLFFNYNDNKKYVASTGYAQLRALGSKSFLYHAIHTDYFVARVLIKCTGSNYPAINSSDLEKIKISAPKTLKEQQKIADCLSSLDTLIVAQADKIDALKLHKKGLMQQIFPREGETVPRLRFPEFQDAGEWGEITLGRIVDIRSGYSPSRYDLSGEAQYAFLKVEDLNNCDKYQKISREFSNDSLGLVPAWSIIFPKRGAAILSNKVRINTVDVLMDTNLMAITPTRGVLAEFLYYIVVTEGLSKIADTSTIPQINNKHITPYVTRIPNKAEQQKIADCLSSLDDLITAHTEKLDALKAHKKGLMQQIFPSLDAAMG